MKGYIHIEPAAAPEDLPEGQTVVSGVMIHADCELTRMERWCVVKQLGESLHYTREDWAEVIAMALHAGPYAGLRTEQYEIGTFEEVHGE